MGNELYVKHIGISGNLICIRQNNINSVTFLKPCPIGVENKLIKLINNSSLFLTQTLQIKINETLFSLSHFLKFHTYICATYYTLFIHHVGSIRSYYMAIQFFIFRKQVLVSNEYLWILTTLLHLLH